MMMMKFVSLCCKVLIPYLPYPAILLVLSSFILEWIPSYILQTNVLLGVQQLWNALGMFCQQLYQGISIACDHNPSTLFIGVTAGVYYVSYWLPVLLFTIIDMSRISGLLRQYKISSDKTEPPNIHTILKCLLVVHLNQVLVTFPTLCCSYYVMMARGGDFTSTLPSLTKLVIHLAVFDVVDEVWSYYSHRILHLRYVYKYVHKMHHEWKNPISISSDYAHPLDHLHTVIPLVLGPLLMGSSPIILWVWVGLVTFSTVVHHSGYHLPFLTSPRFHFYHHQKPLECYGSMGLLDNLHGTDHTYKRSHHYPIDTTYYSLTPPVPPKQH